MNGGKIPWIRVDQRKIGMVQGGPEEGPEIKGKDNGSGNPAEKGEEKKPGPVYIQPSPGFARDPRCAGIQKSLQVIGFAVKKHNLNLLAEIVNSGILPIIIAKSRDSFTFLPVLQAEFPP